MEIVKMERPRGYQYIRGNSHGGNADLEALPVEAVDEFKVIPPPIAPPPLPPKKR